MQGKFHLCTVFLFWELRGLSPNFHIHVSVSHLRSWKYINLSQIYDCRNWETEHYYSILKITVSFLGIQKQEPEIYIGFSLALHLQCSLGIVSLGFKDAGIKQTSLYFVLNSLLAEVKNRVLYLFNQNMFPNFSCRCYTVQHNWYIYCLFTFT